MDSSVSKKVDFPSPITLFSWHTIRWKEKGNTFIR
jgi:hypothetical protein